MFIITYAVLPKTTKEAQNETVQNFDHSEFTKTARDKLYQKTQNTTPSYG
jgi:hypothetical protein